MFCSTIPIYIRISDPALVTQSTGVSRDWVRPADSPGATFRPGQTPSRIAPTAIVSDSDERGRHPRYRPGAGTLEDSREAMEWSSRQGGRASEGCGGARSCLHPRDGPLDVAAAAMALAGEGLGDSPTSRLFDTGGRNDRDGDRAPGARILKTTLS